MSAYKKLKSQDSFVTTYVAKKNWYLSGSIIDLASFGIQALYALSGSEEVAELSVGKSTSITVLQTVIYLTKVLLTLL